MQARRLILAVVVFVCGYLATQWRQPGGENSPPSGRDREIPARTSEPPKSSGNQQAAEAAPEIRSIWARQDSLLDHYQRHGGDFGATSPEDYARKAWAFRQKALRDALPMKRDSEGVLRVFEPGTNAFGAYNRDGKARTYFKAKGMDYFQRQPGENVTPADVR